MKTRARKILKAILPDTLLAAVRLFRGLPRRVARLERQVSLNAAHAARRAGAAPFGPALHSVLNGHELQVYSQHGEDGIVQFIFGEIGAPHRTFVEFGMGDGRECNTALLSLHAGWRGLLLDADGERVAAARAFYERMLGPGQEAVRIEQAWVTAENIDDTIRSAGIAGEIDLLSIDLDGMDYWVWRSLEAVRPRAVIVEYSAVLGAERACTVPYDPGFSRWRAHPGGLYAGASLAALEKLGREKGYRLAGCNAHGVNAFFIREDLAPDSIPAVNPARAWYPCDDLLLGLITPERFADVAHLPWEEV